MTSSWPANIDNPGSKATIGSLKRLHQDNQWHCMCFDPWCVKWLNMLNQKIWFFHFFLNPTVYLHLWCCLCMKTIKILTLKYLYCKNVVLCPSDSPFAWRRKGVELASTLLEMFNLLNLFELIHIIKMSVPSSEHLIMYCKFHSLEYGICSMW